ncbi:MAG: serine hydrolase [Proteobacteria bacterium]|nr:serine hydrolase [Pseudomonadota bacterium]MBI3497976.1 serine hydrolase [Pseudomonadota bacterium]
MKTSAGALRYKRTAKHPTLAVVIVAISLLSLSVPAKADCNPPQEGLDWPIATPESVGLNRTTLCALVDKFDAWTTSELHSVLVVRHGKLVFEHYFTATFQDQRIQYDAERKNDMRSITKSVTSLLLGAAIDRGWVASIDLPVLSFFPEYADLATPEKERITIRHLLMMAHGLEWDERRPYSDPTNSEIVMGRSPDPYRYALEQPVAKPPGTVFNYSAASSALIAGMLRKQTNRPLDALARILLLDPLGIASVEWYRYSNGHPAASYGLIMRPRDLAKIGQLVLGRGLWNGTQIVSSAWIDAATAPQIQVNAFGTPQYGYQFWLGYSVSSDGKRKVDWSAGLGLGGQRVNIMPSLDLVVVITAGLYTSSLQSTVPTIILSNYVLPAVE